MKQFSVEEIKRLVPESNLVDEGVSSDIMGRPFMARWFRALLTTRAQLEVAVACLKEYDDGVAPEALSKIKELGE